MSRNAKIALIVVGTILVLCVGACGLGWFALQRFGDQFNNPSSGQEIGSQIADYALPEGYVERGINLLVYKMVVIAPEDGNGGSDSLVFMLMNTSAGAANEQEMERAMQQSFQQQFNRNGGTTHVVGTEHVMIRGKDTVLTIAENDSKPPLKQVVGTFSGKNGVVILMVIGAKNTWNDTLFKNFVASIQ